MFTAHVVDKDDLPSRLSTMHDTALLLNSAVLAAVTDVLSDCKSTDELVRIARRAFNDLITTLGPYMKNDPTAMMAGNLLAHIIDGKFDPAQCAADAKSHSDAFEAEVYRRIGDGDASSQAN